MSQFDGNAGEIKRWASNAFPNRRILQICLPATTVSFLQIAKKMLQRMRYGSNEKVIAETQAYFESNDKTFYTTYNLVRRLLDQCVSTYYSILYYVHMCILHAIICALAPLVNCERYIMFAFACVTLYSFRIFATPLHIKNTNP